MDFIVELPVLGDTAQTGVINKWLVGVGGHVETGQTLVVVESDKAVVDVPSPVTGTVVEHLVTVADEIEIGTPIAIIDDTVQ